MTHFLVQDKNASKLQTKKCQRVGWKHSEIHFFQPNFKELKVCQLNEWKGSGYWQFSQTCRAGKHRTFSGGARVGLRTSTWGSPVCLFCVTVWHINKPVMSERSKWIHIYSTLALATSLRSYGSHSIEWLVCVSDQPIRSKRKNAERQALSSFTPQTRFAVLQCLHSVNRLETIPFFMSSQHISHSVGIILSQLCLSSRSSDMKSRTLISDLTCSISVQNILT